PSLDCSPEDTVTIPPRSPASTGQREVAYNKSYRPSEDCTRAGNQPAEPFVRSADFLPSYREMTAFRRRSNADPQKRSTKAVVGSRGSAPALSPQRYNDAAVGGPSPGIVASHR